MKHRQVTKAGIALIKAFEGFSALPYKDVANLWTVGYGHLIRQSEAFTRVSEQEAEDLLANDLFTAERAVLGLTKVTLTDNQFNALVSFVFNLGSGAYQRSTLRSKINRGEYELSAGEFLKWIWAGGKKIKGLLRRRIAERDLFLNTRDVIFYKP